MPKPTASPSETVLTDQDGDHLEIQVLEGDVYVTVDQNGVIATVGPFPISALNLGR